MYIFELLYKSCSNLYRRFKSVKPDSNKDEPVYEKCEHIFLPIDSTKKILACSKCGTIVKKQDIMPKAPENFFAKKNLNN